MHGAVLLDERDDVLRPAILWNDGRSRRECAELEARVPDLRERCGNLCMPGFTAPKLLWVARHEPDADRHERLGEKWRRYRRLYDDTRPLNRDATDAGEPQ
jgi:xylulokinase